MLLAEVLGKSLCSTCGESDSIAGALWLCMAQEGWWSDSLTGPEGRSYSASFLEFPCSSGLVSWALCDSHRHCQKELSAVMEMFSGVLLPATCAF